MKVFFIFLGIKRESSIIYAAKKSGAIKCLESLSNSHLWFRINTCIILILSKNMNNRIDNYRYKLKI
jgi:hypothetical protein